MAYFFRRQRRIYQTVLRPGLQKRERPVHKERRKDRFRPSNASVCHDLLWDGDIRKLYICRLYPSFRTRAGAHAPTDSGCLQSDGKPEAFDYSEETYIRPFETAWEQGVLVVPPEVPSMESLYKFFNKKQWERTCYVLHDYDDFVTILRDLQMSGGQMLTALNIQDEPIGMIFFYPAGDHIYVKELMYDNDHIKKLLLQEATTQNKVEKAVYRTPFTGPGTFPLGMARVLDRDRLIHHWASTHENSVLNIGELKEMDTQSLTRLLLDYQSREAYMSLMLD